MSRTIFHRMPMIAGRAAGVLFAAWLIGQVFRDRFWLTGLCFYLPSPLVAGSLLLVVFTLWRRDRRRGKMIVLAACAPLMVVLTLENRWSPAPSDDDHRGNLRLVHWNVFWANLGWEPVEARLRPTDADMYVLSEIPPTVDVHALARRLGPDYVGLRLGDLAAVARGQLNHIGQRQAGHARAHVVDWRIGGTSLTVLVVDLPSNIGQARAPLLGWVRDIIDERRPDLVVGDFNAPRRSLGLSSLPRGYAHAYDRVGTGWSYTWPVPVPLWAIDQCVVSPRIRPTRYELRSTVVSDHRFQILDFRIAEDSPRSLARR